MALIISALGILPSILKSYTVKGLEGVKIQLMFGDILDSKMNIIIPTNTSFDTDFSCIKKNSLQGQVCNRFYNGNPKLIYSKLNSALSDTNLSVETIPSKKVGNKIRYPKDSIVCLRNGVDADAQTFYWIAINDHDDFGNVPICSIKITESLQKLWDYFKVQRRVQSVAIPIIGTGLAGINQPTFDVFEYIVDSFIQVASEYRIVETLRIYIYPKNYLSYQDFELANKYLKFRCENPLTVQTKNVF